MSLGSSPSGTFRNVAIIAHVDHGKTTLVDQLLKQSGNFRAGELEKLEGGQHGLIMDSNPLERERGITILSKNCAIRYVRHDGTEFRINIIDTPGHADFGGEVERVLRMADGCLLLVDAFDGPMPQTKFVLGKALELGLTPIVVVNKCDRPGARPDAVVHEVFDLFVELGAEEIALNFTTVYASGRDGWASPDWKKPGEDLRPIFEAIVQHVPAPDMDASAPLQMLVTTLDHSEFVGRIGIGRVFAGTIRKNDRIALIQREDYDERFEDPTTNHDAPDVTSWRVVQLLQFQGLKRVEVDEVRAGDLCAVVGIEDVDIGDTIADPDHPVPLPPVSVDEPTMTMLFRINDSPFAGQDGKYLTSRQIRERLEKEAERNVAMRLESGNTSDEFLVAGRGTLHLGILLENMRREGFELSVGKPHVIEKTIDSVRCEPIEELVIDVPTGHIGRVMELIGSRKGELRKMEPRGDTITHMVFEITSRALIGLRSKVLTATQGEAIIHHRFTRYAPVSGPPQGREQGVMISSETGPATAHAAELLHDRGVLFVEPQDKVYAGQIVGEHNRDNDIVVNICRLKHLTNVRSSTKEQTFVLKAARTISMEEAIEYIEDDELVEITPGNVRLRKRILDESMRRRSERQARDREAAMS